VPDIWNTLGEQLREARVRKGISLRDINGEGDGDLSKTAVSRIELGERIPNAASLLVLARALGVSIVFSPDGVEVKPYRRRPKK